MARLMCPCCGKPYNGKKCDECLYEPFGDVEVHNHAHGTYGIPATQTWKSVIQTEAEERKPVVVSAPQQTSHRKTTHAGKRLLPIFLIPIICIVLSLLFSFVWYWNETLQSNLLFGGAYVTLPMMLQQFTYRFEAMFGGDASGGAITVSTAISMAGTLLSILPVLILYVFMQNMIEIKKKKFLKIYYLSWLMVKMMIQQ